MRFLIRVDVRRSIPVHSVRVDKKTPNILHALTYQNLDMIGLHDKTVQI